jgi:sulfatase maturation enzyme AslB (radical SAM superfamily)
MANLSIADILPSVRNKDLEFRKYANLLAALIGRRERWNYAPAKPGEITVDLSTVCNLKCPYCATGNGTLDRVPGVLRFGTHNAIMRFCGAELFLCSYFSNGEPLLNRHLPELMAEAAEKEVFSVISTNLSVPIARQRLEALIDSGVNLISASIDGATEETYVQYRVGGDFRLVLENLKSLVAIKKERGREFPIIEWRFLLFEHNQHEIPAVLEKGEEIGVDLVEFFYGNAPPDAPFDAVRRSTLHPLPVAAVHGPYLEKSLLRTDTLLRRRLIGQSDPIHESPLPNDEPKCDWLYFGGMYYPDGHVGPCCVVGNTKWDFGSLETDGGYDQIWNGAKYQAARQVFKSQKRHPQATICHRCPLPAAQDQMFKNSLRAYLLNAPRWFLALVSADPERFFHPRDFALLPREVHAIAAMKNEGLPLPSAVLERLFRRFDKRPRVSRILHEVADKGPGSV